MPPVNLFEYEELAREVLPQMAYDYYASGADDEISLAENRAAYGRIPLYYRVLRDIDRRSLETTVLGIPVAMPILAAPTAFHKLAHPEGEVASVRAVGRHGSILILSTLSTCPLEEVVAAATGPVPGQPGPRSSSDLPEGVER